MSVTLVARACISICIMFFYKAQLVANEGRASCHGIRLYDAILHRLPYRTDRGEIGYVMLLMYSIALCSTVIAHDKYTVCRLLISYVFDLSIIYMIKCVTLYCCPLLPPVQNHYLVDPVLSNFNMLYRNDLLFSGHAASTFLLILYCPGNYITKCTLCLIWYVLVNLLLITRCHYTIDIVIAPFISYSVYKFNVI